jgi:hypothetical protein
MTDGDAQRALLHRLARCLAHLPCSCVYARNAQGVPLWFPAEGGGIERRLERECERCVLIREAGDG